MLGILSLLPKEEKFYEMVDQLTEEAGVTARALNEMVNSTHREDRIRLGQQIAKSKARAKGVYERLNSEVCHTFITPFDREDLQELGSLLYNITKMMEKAQGRMIIHRLQSEDNDFIRMVDVIVAQQAALEKTIHILNKEKKLKAMHAVVGELDNLEDQSDVLLGQLIGEMFERSDDHKEWILRKDLYEMLEDVTDYYRDCGNLALQIILKHS